MSVTDSLGRYVTTSEKLCRSCGSKLEIRAVSESILIHGVEADMDTKYEYCNQCGTSVKVTDHKSRRDRYDRLEKRNSVKERSRERSGRRT